MGSPELNSEVGLVFVWATAGSLQALGLLAPGGRLCSVAEVPNPKPLGLEKGRISLLNPWDDPQQLRTGCI